MNDEVIGRETDSNAPSFSAFVHGPSFFPRVPLALPYWNGETYRNILRCIASRSINDGADLARLKSQIEELLGVYGALLCGSCRFSLDLALPAFGEAPGDGVVLPRLSCPAFVAGIFFFRATSVRARFGRGLY